MFSSFLEWFLIQPHPARCGNPAAPGGTRSSPAPGTGALGQKMCRDTCTTELYSQNGLYQGFSMQKWNMTQNPDGIEALLGSQQVRLELPPASAPKGCKLVPSQSSFSSPDVGSLNCPMQFPYSATWNAGRRQGVMADRPEQHTAHAAKNQFVL